MNIVPYQNGEDYQSIYENAIEGIFQSTLDGRYLRVNSATARIYGYKSPEDMLHSVTDIRSQIYVDQADRKRFIDELKEKGHVEGFVARNYRKDQSIIWVQTNARIVQDAEGNILYFEGFLADITTRKETEIALRASEEKYRALVERLSGALFLDDPYNSESTIYISSKIEDILGYSPEEWVSKVNWSEIIHPDDRKRVVDANTRTDKTGEIFREEYRIQKKDGEYIWIREEASLVKDDEEIPLFWQGLLTDITEEKQAEVTLRQSEAQFKKIFQANPLASCIATLSEGRFIAANDAYWKMSGYKPDEIIGHTSIELGFVDAEKRRTILKKLDAEKSIKNASGKLITKNGEIRNTLEFFDLVTFDGQECILTMFYDVTDQFQVQRTLQENEEKYRQLFEAESDAIFLFDHETGKILEANAAAVALYGYSKEELLKKKNADLSAEPEETQDVTQNTPLDREKIVVVPLRFHRKKDGTVFPVEITGRFFEWRGKAVHIVAIRDISERKKVEDALQTSEERFRLAFHTSPDSININRMEDGLYVDVNEGFTATTGYSREDVIGKTSMEINIWGDQKDRDKLVDQLKRHGFVDNTEAKFRIKDGSLVTGLISARVILLEGVPHIISIVKEIETLKQVHETLQRQLKELTILHNVALAASSSESEDELIQRITDTIADSLYSDNCGVELVTEDGKAVFPHYSYRGIVRTELREPLPISQGVVGKAIKSGDAIRLGDVSKDKAYIEATPGIKSELCVPIRTGKEIIGVLNVESKQPDAFTETDERLLNTVAGNLGNAIERIRLFNSEQIRRQNAEALREATTALTQSLDLDTFLEAILDNLSRIVTFDSASVTLLENDELVIKAGRGFPDGYFVVGKRLNVNQFWKKFNERKAVIIPDVQANPDFEQWEGSEYIRCWMGVPMVINDNLLGYINIDNREVNAYTEKDTTLVQTFANSAAVALDNIRLFEAEQQNHRRADALRDATAALATPIDLQTLYDVILDSLKKLVPYDSASIEILEQGYLHLVTGKGLRGNQSTIGTRYVYRAEKWGERDLFRAPLIIPNVQEDTRFEKLEGTDYIRGWMGVPLLVQDKLIGFLNLDSETENFFTEEHASLAQTYGNQAAIAIENAHLFADEQAQKLRNSALLDMMRVAASSLELEQVMHTILGRLSELLPSSSGTIQLVEGKSLRIAATVGIATTALMVGDTLQLEAYPLNQLVLEKKQPIYIKNTEADNRYVFLSGRESVRSFLIIPLIYKNKVIGIMTLDSTKPDRFSQQDFDFAMAVANHAAIAIENARLFEAEQRRHRESETLRQAALAITTSLELESVLDAILIVMKQVVPYDSASVFLQDGDSLNLVAIQGFQNTEQLLSLSFPSDDDLYQSIKQSELPLILADVQDDQRFKKWGETDQVRGWMGVPLTVRGETIGCITLDSHKPSIYDTNLATLAQAFANQAATAIHNARQFEAEQRHYREAETLRQAAETITSTLEIREVLTTILSAVRQVVPYDSVSLFLIEEKDNVRLTAAQGLPDIEAAIDMFFPLSNQLFQELLESGQPLIIDDVREDSRFERWVADERVHGWMGIPLTVRGSVIGFITIDSFKPNIYTDHDATLALTFAHQAAAAIENARLFERSETQIRRLTVLRDIDNAISSSFDLNVTLNILTGQVVRELEVNAAAILLYNPAIQSLSYFTGVGFKNYNIARHQLRIGEGLASQVILRREAIHIRNLDEAPEFSRGNLIKGENFIHYFGVPLIGKGQIKGVLELYSRSPINSNSDWLNFLQTLAGQAAIAIDNVQLFKNLQRSNQELSLAYDTTLEGWGKALELRDKETQGHTRRVSDLTINLARRVGIHGEELAHVLRGTLLHDIGKMGIPDSILNKPGPLTDEEWEIMRQHPQYAYDLMHPIPYLRPALDIPYCHHERWDGSGYPRGLTGEEIPLAARIFAVIDIWDALLYDRPYREAWPEEKVLEYIKKQAGTQLDSFVVKEFIRMLKEEKREQAE